MIKVSADVVSENPDVLVQVFRVIEVGSYFGVAVRVRCVRGSSLSIHPSVTVSLVVSGPKTWFFPRRFHHHCCGNRLLDSLVVVKFVAVNNCDVLDAFLLSKSYHLSAVKRVILHW